MQSCATGTCGRVRTFLNTGHKNIRFYYYELIGSEIPGKLIKYPLNDAS
jgi:hypothetical protein